MDIAQAGQVPQRLCLVRKIVIKVPDRHGDTQPLIARGFRNFKVGFRLQSASAHEHIGDAGFCSVSELYLDVELIIPIKIGIVNVVEDVPLVIHPVFLYKLGSR